MINQSESCSAPQDASTSEALISYFVRVLTLRRATCSSNSADPV
jgi:hypothetical protein